MTEEQAIAFIDEAIANLARSPESELIEAWKIVKELAKDALLDLYERLDQ